MKVELMKRWREREFGHMGLDYMADKAMDVAPSVIARWIIDIVADAREIEREATFEHFRQRQLMPGGLQEIKNDIEATRAEPRKHEGFTMTTELTGSIESVSVAITAEFIEAIWRSPEPLPPMKTCVGDVGRFSLWTVADGSTWAAVDSMGVMVVKPDPTISPK